VLTTLLPGKMFLFVSFVSDDLDSFLLLAEKQRIVLHELKLIRAQKDRLDIPGFKDVELYDGEVISKYLPPYITRDG